MVNFHELQELFLLSHAHGILDDEELLILYEEYWPKNPDFCYENYERFSLDDMNDAECLAEFRFRKHDLPLLADVLQIPDSFTCYQRTVTGGMEGLCVLLRLSSQGEIRRFRISEILQKSDGSSFRHISGGWKHVRAK